MSSMRVLPIQQYTAADHTRKAILQRVYARYHFPFEAAILTISLHTAIEILLRFESGNSRIKMEHLIDKKEQWDLDLKNIAHWIRERRNDVLHEGKFPTHEQEIALKYLDSGIHLLGLLWIDQIGSLSDVFNPYETTVLMNQVIDWQHESEFYARAALGYCHLDETVAVEIANLAFDISARGFAMSWDIKDVRTKTITELYNELEVLDNDSAHLSLYDDHVNPEINFKVFGGEHAPWFYPPMTLEMLLQPPLQWNARRAASCYCQEILDVVMSYASRVHYGMLNDCLNRNWPSILSKMHEKYPELDLPTDDITKWSFRFLKGSTFYFPGRLFKGESNPSTTFSAEQLKFFKKKVEELCGPLPSDIEL